MNIWEKQGFISRKKLLFSNCEFYRLCHVILTVHFIENNLLLTLKVFDPGEVLYIYESPAGIGICVLRIIVSII